jgi:hypothetical protein
MAIGRKTGGRNFKPGQSGNPSGEKPSKEKLELRRLTRDELVALIRKTAFMPRVDLDDRMNDPSLPLLEVCILRIFDKVIQTGDHSGIEWLMSRSIGKVKEEMDVTHNDGVTIVKRISDGSELIMGPREAIEKMTHEPN